MELLRRPLLPLVAPATCIVESVLLDNCSRVEPGAPILRVRYPDLENALATLDEAIAIDERELEYLIENRRPRELRVRERGRDVAAAYDTYLREVHQAYREKLQGHVDSTAHGASRLDLLQVAAESKEAGHRVDERELAVLRFDAEDVFTTDRLARVIAEKHRRATNMRRMADQTEIVAPIGGVLVLAIVKEAFAAQGQALAYIDFSENVS